VEALSVDEFRVLVEDRLNPEPAGYDRLATAALVSLRTGTMSAADVLEHLRPAALAVTMGALYDEADDWLPGERRAGDDLRILIAQYASEQFADDPRRWARAVARVNTYPGTVPELFADIVSDRDRDPDSDRRTSVDFSDHIISDFDAPNVLLALAPRDVAERALAAKGMKRTITAAAGEAPLCRALVEHVITRGTVPQREQLAANEVTPDAILARLLENTEQTDILLTIMEREEVGAQILERAYAAAPRRRALKEWIADCASDDPAKALHALRSTSDDAVWLLSVLRVAVSEFGEPGRIAAFALLAEVAGVEAVWALELDRTGTLEKMAPYVRASMATGDAEPLIEAARLSPVPESEKTPYYQQWRTEQELDHPLRRPLEAVIRTHLDDRVDRWLELAELLVKPASG
jgi:hypothetical protein